MSQLQKSQKWNSKWGWWGEEKEEEEEEEIVEEEEVEEEEEEEEWTWSRRPESKTVKFPPCPSAEQNEETTRHQQKGGSGKTQRAQT